MIRAIDRIGTKFGRLLITDVAMSARGRPVAVVVCDCGTIKTVRVDQIVDGTTKSCGCFNLEAISARAFRHGMARTNLYKIWHAMVRRCVSPKCEWFYNYGGRGIKVCDAWKDFSNFYADMGDRPSKQHTLERIDNNGNYEPGNVKWALRAEQLRNTRRSRKYLWHGKSLCITDLAAVAGINRNTLTARLDRLPLLAAMTEPIR